VGRRISANVAIELQDRHPTPFRDVNRSNYYDVAPLDTTWPDPPLLAPKVGRLRVRLAKLVRKKTKSVQVFFPGYIRRPDAEKFIHRSPNLLGEFGDGDWVAHV
jgi:hypothetical protein